MIKNVAEEGDETWCWEWGQLWLSFTLEVIGSMHMLASRNQIAWGFFFSFSWRKSRYPGEGRVGKDAVSPCQTSRIWVLIIGEKRLQAEKKNKSLHQWLSVKGPFLWSSSNKLWYYMEKRPFPPIMHWK